MAKIKCKGSYQYDDLGWHQNHSALIIPRAAVEYLINKVPIEDTIRNHKDKYDFMYRTKVPRSSRLVSKDEHSIENIEQRISRYYVSNSGVELTKIMPPLAGKNKVETTWRNPDTGDEITTTKKPTRKGFTEKVKEVELPPEERHIGIQTGQKVKICNDITKYDGDINYDYYIQEAKKLTEEVVGENNP